MGSARRPHPKQLAAKLFKIRRCLNLTQEEMAKRFDNIPSPPQPAHISRFENGIREPSLLMLLAYARVAGIPMEALVDDDIELPNKLLGQARKGIRGRSNSNRK
jgi:transcriptional regulator with XRE-family HTH domain